MDSHNLFKNRIIIQNFKGLDKEVLRKLREASSLYNNILSTNYFDLLQNKISINLGLFCGKIQYYVNHEKTRQRYSLKLEDWDPSMTPIFRKLEARNLFGKPRGVKIKLHQIIDQCSSYIQTLIIADLPDLLSSSKLLKFIQKFSHLKNLTIEVNPPSVNDSWFDELENTLIQLKDSQLGKRVTVELKLVKTNVSLIEELFVPGKMLKTHINGLMLDSPKLENTSDLQRFAQLIPRIKSIISGIKLDASYWNRLGQRVWNNKEDFITSLKEISPFVTSVELIAEEFFISALWPSLLTLRFYSYGEQLPDLSKFSPRLETLTISFDQLDDDEWLFGVPDVYKYNTKDLHAKLNHIFSGCVKSLKKLIIDSIYSKTLDRMLYSHLQELLPNTIITRYAYGDDKQYDSSEEEVRRKSSRISYQSENREREKILWLSI